MSENDGIDSKGRILRGDAIGQGRILAAVEGIARILSPTNETIATISPMWANLVARFGVQGHATYFASGSSTLDSIFGMDIQGNAYKVSSSLMEVTATMESDGVRIATSTATLPVVTTVDSDGTLILVSSSDLLATFGFTSEGVYVGGGTATLDVNTTLDSDGTLTASGVATMAMVATLSAIPSGVVYQGGATLDVVSSLTATMWRLIRGTVDPLNAEFSVTSSGDRTAGGQGTLFGEFGLEVGTTNVFKNGSATLDAITSLAIDATASYVSGSSLENAFHLASDAFLLFNAMATLSSTFELTSEAIRVATGDSTLDVEAGLTSDASKVANGDSTLDAEFDLASSAAARIGGDAQLDMLADIDALPTRIPERGYRMHFVYPHPSPATAKYQIYTQGRGWEVTDEEWDIGDGSEYRFAFFKYITLASVYHIYVFVPTDGFGNGYTEHRVFYRQPTAYMTWASEEKAATLNSIHNGTWDVVWANDRWHFVIMDSLLEPNDSPSAAYGLKYWRRTDSGADINATLRVPDATYDRLGRNLSLFADGNGHLHIVCYHQRISDNRYVLHHYLSTNNGTSWTEYEDSTRSYVNSMSNHFMGENNAIVSLARVSNTSFDVIHRDPFGTWTAHTITDGSSNIAGRFAHVNESGEITVVYSEGINPNLTYKKIVWNGSWSSPVTIYDTSVRSHGWFSQFVQDPDGNLHWIENQGEELDSRVIHHQWTGTHSEDIIDTNPAGTMHPSLFGISVGNEWLKLEQWRNIESTTTLDVDTTLDANGTYVTNADATLPVEATVEARGGFVIEGSPDPLPVEANVTAAGSRMILGTSAMEAYAGLTGSGIYVGKTLSTLNGEFGFSAEGEVISPSQAIHAMANKGTNMVYWTWDGSSWSGGATEFIMGTSFPYSSSRGNNAHWNVFKGALETSFVDSSWRIGLNTGSGTWSNTVWDSLTDLTSSSSCMTHDPDTGHAHGLIQRIAGGVAYMYAIEYDGSSSRTTVESSNTSSGTYSQVGNFPIIGISSSGGIWGVWSNRRRTGGAYEMRYTLLGHGTTSVPSASGHYATYLTSYQQGDNLHMAYSHSGTCYYKVLDMSASFGTGWSHYTLGTGSRIHGIWSDGTDTEILYVNNNLYKINYNTSSGWGSPELIAVTYGTTIAYKRDSTGVWHSTTVQSGNLEHWHITGTTLTKDTIQSSGYTSVNSGTTWFSLAPA